MTSPGRPGVAVGIRGANPGGGNAGDNAGGGNGGDHDDRDDGRPTRPIAIDIVAALLVFGGLFGAAQLLFGDFVITGPLPAKGPLLGVAAVLYASSVALGVLIRTGRGWLPAINLAGAFAVVYLAAFGHASTFVLGIAHGAAALSLIRTRSWFATMARWRGQRSGADLSVSAHGPDAANQARPRTPRAGGSRRPSGRR